MKIQTKPFRKVVDATAADICARVDLSPEAKSYLLPTLSPQGYLSLLVDAEQIGDAIRFLAFALPVREGIWWACTTARSTMANPTELEVRCLDEASAWVYQPDEARRRTCMALAESADFDGAAAYAALSVFWSGGSMAPEGMPDVPPNPNLGPIGVGASVLLAITTGEERRLNERFKEAILRGVDIANGGNGRLEADATAAVPL